MMGLVPAYIFLLPEVYFLPVETLFGNCDGFSWRYEARVTP